LKMSGDGDDFEIGFGCGIDHVTDFEIDYLRTIGCMIGFEISIDYGSMIFVAIGYKNVLQTIKWGPSKRTYRGVCI